MNTSFRDSTTFLVQARTKRGFAGVDIEIDTPKYPLASHKSPFRDATATFMEDYLLNTRNQYYMEGGMRVYNLKEVLITGNRSKPRSESIYTGGINTYTIEGDKLESGGAQTAFDAVSRLPGVSVTNGNEIHIRNNPEQPVIVIDHVVYEDDNDILTMIQTSDMSSLSLLHWSRCRHIRFPWFGRCHCHYIKRWKRPSRQTCTGVLSRAPHWDTAIRLSSMYLLTIPPKRRMHNVQTYGVLSTGTRHYNWTQKEK